MHIASFAAEYGYQQSTDPLLAQVVKVVAEDFGVSIDEMMMASRGHDVWKPRMAAMYFCRLLTDCSLPELGRAFEGRSHTTVLRAFRRCRSLMEQDTKWAQRMDSLLARLVERVLLPNSCMPGM